MEGWRVTQVTNWVLRDFSHGRDLTCLNADGASWKKNVDYGRESSGWLVDTGYWGHGTDEVWALVEELALARKEGKRIAMRKVEKISKAMGVGLWLVNRSPARNSGTPRRWILEALLSPIINVICSQHIIFWKCKKNSLYLEIMNINILLYTFLFLYVYLFINMFWGVCRVFFF